MINTGLLVVVGFVILIYFIYSSWLNSGFNVFITGVSFGDRRWKWCRLQCFTSHLGGNELESLGRESNTPNVRSSSSGWRYIRADVPQRQPRWMWRLLHRLVWGNLYRKRSKDLSWNITMLKISKLRKCRA